MRARRSGFTLLELIVAVSIGAMVLTVGRAIFDASVDMQRRFTTAFADIEAERIGRTTLANAFATAQVAVDAPLSGTASAVSFVSRCRDAYGGTVRCHVTVSADPALVLREEVRVGEARTLVVARVPGRFEYVIDAAHGGTLIREWHSTTLPLAVRWTPLAPTADTLTFPILWAVH